MRTWRIMEAVHKLDRGTRNIRIVHAIAMRHQRLQSFLFRIAKLIRATRLKLLHHLRHIRAIAIKCHPQIALDIVRQLNVHGWRQRLMIIGESFAREIALHKNAINNIILVGARNDIAEWHAHLLGKAARQCIAKCARWNSDIDHAIAMRLHSHIAPHIIAHLTQNTHKIDGIHRANLVALHKSVIFKYLLHHQSLLVHGFVRGINAHILRLSMHECGQLTRLHSTRLLIWIQHANLAQFGIAIVDDRVCRSWSRIATRLHNDIACLLWLLLR
mmetsp:Transcript_10807/g.16273  ORF Transcript_10807/g.16273 Transcript_10807/m.16273 type:complete len:273 (+) Transcript_10807:754-1572(+)